MKVALPKVNKQLGQHYLTSQKVISQIVNTKPVNAEAILEIGPGPAIISKFLNELKLPMYFLEKDHRFIPYLEPLVENDHIFLDDALLFDLNKLPQHDWWIVSNLPYNVGVPITLRLFQYPAAKYLTLMMQKEVTEKFHPRTKNDMNSLHVLTKCFFNVSKVCHVSPGSFSPPPKVDSEVLYFERLKTPLVPLNEWDKLEKFLRILFAHRRKQIMGVLKGSFSADLVENILNKLNIPPQQRAHSLELGHVIQLYKNFNP